MKKKLLEMMSRVLVVESCEGELLSLFGQNQRWKFTNFSVLSAKKVWRTILLGKLLEVFFNGWKFIMMSTIWGYHDVLKKFCNTVLQYKLYVGYWLNVIVLFGSKYGRYESKNFQIFVSNYYFVYCFSMLLEKIWYKSWEIFWLLKKLCEL